jgi:hypothetical protein
MKAVDFIAFDESLTRFWSDSFRKTRHDRGKPGLPIGFAVRTQVRNL